MRVTVSMLAAASLVLVGCSSGDDSAEPDRPDVAADEPAAEEPAADDSASDEPVADEPAAGDSTDVEPPATIEPAPADPDEPDTTEPPLETLPLDPISLAERALLTAADFPADWTATPEDPDSAEDDELDERVNACVGLGPDSIVPQLDDLDAESPEFESPDGNLGVEHSVVVLPDEETAIAAMADVTSDAVPGCLVQIFGEFFGETMADPDQADFPPGTELGEMTAEPLDIGAAPDIAAATRFVIPIVFGDTTVTLVYETWYVRQGRALAQVEFRSTDDIFPIDGVEALVDTVAARLAQVG